jgi:CPA2 family monovalent cation:H+ antiporter-2
MAGEVSPGEYKDVLLFLATAGVAAPLFRRWRISPILGFLGAGVLLGPSGLARFSGSFPWLTYFTVDNPDEIAQLAEFGVVFLLFMIGLELSWERLRLLRRLVFGLGGLQVLICGTAIATAAVAMGQPIHSGAAIGAALALSSTAIVMPILTESRRQHSQAGRTVFAVLLLQDLAVAPILITLTLMGSRGGAGAELSPKLLLTFAPAALGMLALVVFGRLLLRPMMRSVARAKSHEMFMAASLLVVLGAGLFSALTGLSMALGAFIAGLLLAETEYRHEVEVTIEPFKGLLLGLFFVSVGIGLDLRLVVATPLMIVGTTLGLIVLNAGVVFGLARAFGLTSRQAIETALLLAAGGEFAFVILNSAADKGIVDHAMAQTVLVSSTLSMFLLPFLADLGAKLGGRPGVALAQNLPAEPDNPVDGPAVLVVGYGRVGRLVGDMLSRHDVAWVAAERDPALVEPGRRAGQSIYYGDASRHEFLERCGLGQARALVVTMDSPEGAEAVVAAARQLYPDLKIVARARDARHAKRLYDLGATDAVPETIEASLQLSEATLVDIGIPMGMVIASIHERRDEFRQELNRPDALGGRRRMRDAGR